MQIPDSVFDVGKQRHIPSDECEVDCRACDYNLFNKIISERTKDEFALQYPSLDSLGYVPRSEGLSS